jgi:hypothetical protein
VLKAKDLPVGYFIRGGVLKAQQVKRPPRRRLSSIQMYKSEEECLVDKS